MEVKRIEVMERYSIHTEDELDSLKNTYPNNWKEQVQFRYRRTNPKVSDIERIVEIPDNHDECRVRFYDGYSIVVRGNFDDLCIELNDIENGCLSDLPEVD
jgi:hypothetical protein